VGAAFVVSGTALAQVWDPVRVQMIPVGSTLELPMVAEHVTIDIDGQHATTKLQQTFHNGTGMSVEGRYTLWAGFGARANGFAYWNGEQKIVGEVFEKETARQVYQRVVNRRRDPGLLEEKGDGEFSFAVAPIVPDEKKRVEVSYSRWLPRRNGVVDVVAPMSRNDTEIEVTITDRRELKGFASSTHEIEVKRLASGKMIVRTKKARRNAQAFALKYEVVERPWTVDAYVHRNKGEDAYFVLTLGAPASLQRVALPKDVTLVIDRSGSMLGEKLNQAREACIAILKQLGEKDRVNVMLFDDTVERLFRAPEPVTAQTRARAMEYVELVREGGGTNLDAALVAALSAQVDGPQPRVVLFFTDGQSLPDPVIKAATDDKHDVRVFTIGLGRDINKSLLSRLAALKRGRFTYIPEAANIEREVAALYSRIESPLLIDFFLESKNATLMNMYPRVLPDLFNNDELVITGRLHGKGTVDFTLTAKEGGKLVTHRTEVALSDEMARPWVGRMWAKLRIDDLLDEISLKGPNKELSDEVTELALAYNFATPYTSFLAIPASELDAVSANQLSNARARKQEVMKRKSGSVALADSETAKAHDPMMASAGAKSRAPVGDSDRVAAHNSPPPSPSLVSESAQDVDGEAGDVDMLSRVTEDRASVPLAKMERGEARRGGCASCSLGGRDLNADSQYLGLLLLASLALVLRRRRDR
jgi:Ca-activated chloride channel family protein